jgi:hypothetical protein
MIIAGINPTQIDTTAAFPLGTETDDPRGGAFAGNKLKYVRANGTIAPFSAVRCDPTFATAAERHTTVIAVSAVAQVLEGVADTITASATAGQFFWLTVKGRATCLTTAATAGTPQGTSTAGQLTDLTTVTSQQAVGKGVIATSATGTPAASQSFVLLS